MKIIVDKLPNRHDKTCPLCDVCRAFYSYNCPIHNDEIVRFGECKWLMTKKRYDIYARDDKTDEVTKTTNSDEEKEIVNVFFNF